MSKPSTIITGPDVDKLWAVLENLPDGYGWVPDDAEDDLASLQGRPEQLVFQARSRDDAPRVWLFRRDGTIRITQANNQDGSSVHDHVYNTIQRDFTRDVLEPLAKSLKVTIRLERH